LQLLFSALDDARAVRIAQLYIALDEDLGESVRNSGCGFRIARAIVDRDDVAQALSRNFKIRAEPACHESDEIAARLRLREEGLLHQRVIRHPEMNRHGGCRAAAAQGLDLSADIASDAGAGNGRVRTRIRIGQVHEQLSPRHVA
jgi:hypothetical protein